MSQGRLRVFFLWLADVFCILAAWGVSVLLYKAVGLGRYEPQSYLRAVSVALVYTAVNFIGKLYHGRSAYPAMPVSPVEELRRLVFSAFATHLIVMAVLGFGHSAEAISRVVLVLAGCLTALSAQIFRDAVRLMLARLNVGQIPAFLVGDGAAAGILEENFATSSYWGFRIVRVFGRSESAELVSAAAASDIRHLFCCHRDDRYFRAQLPELVRQFAFIEYLPTPMAFPLSDARVLDIGGLGGLEMVNQQQLRLLRIEKRVLDLALSVIILVLSLPFFVLVPILIKCTSRGPVFYRAKRLGKKGRPIRVWKFRSMYADADARLEGLLARDPELAAEFAANFKLRNDPRITPLGRILRKTSIDELPQLINVFTHDMALIGPRPIVEKEIPYYGKAFDLFASVKPGITGLWQASGRSNTDYATRVALDVRYILNWSPWLDLWIVFRTVAAVLKMKGSC